MSGDHGSFRLEIEHKCILEDRSTGWPTGSSSTPDRQQNVFSGRPNQLAVATDTLLQHRKIMNGCVNPP